MKKTERILVALAAASEALTAEEVAAAIGEPDDGKAVSAMLTYLRGKGHAEGSGKAGPTPATWTISDAGREWIADVAAEAGEDSPPTTKLQRRTAKTPRTAPAQKKPRLPLEPPGTEPSEEDRIGLALGEDGCVLPIAAGGHIQQALRPELVSRIVAFAMRSRS